MQPYSPKPGKRHNLFVLAFKNFPGSIFATVIGIAFWGSPFLYNFFRDKASDSVFLSLVLTGAIIMGIPLITLYLVTLLRAGKIRQHLEAESEHRLEIISNDLEALEAKEIKEEKEVIRLEQVVR